MLEYQTPHHIEQSENTFDERQAEVVATGEFWRLYKDEVHELFGALGKEAEWSDSPEDWLPMVRKRWIGNEHGYSEDKEQFTDEQTTAALQILEKMGFTGELTPTIGHYREAVILSGTTAALQKRLPWLADRGITADRVAVLAGQRPIDEKRDGTKAELLSAEGRFGGHDVSDDAWAGQALGGERSLFETDMVRVMLLKKFGWAALRRIDMELLDRTHLTDQEVQERLPRRMGSIPPRIAKDYYFTVPVTVDGEKKEQDVVVLNGAAVPRKQGEPRPTTASTVIEWLERLAPPVDPEGKPVEVLVLSGNPHTLRTVEEMQRTLKYAGRYDIRLVPAGTVPANGPPIQLLQTALGEVGRLIDNDPTAHESK